VLHEQDSSAPVISHRVTEHSVIEQSIVWEEGNDEQLKEIACGWRRSGKQRPRRPKQMAEKMDLDLERISEL
jgi:hypothetical protein